MRFITAFSTIETLALFAGALAFADGMTLVAEGTWFELPTFVWHWQAALSFAMC